MKRLLTFLLVLALRTIGWLLDLPNRLLEPIAVLGGSFATWDLTPQQGPLQPNFLGNLLGMSRLQCYENYYDATKIPAANGDTIKLFPLQAGMLVLGLVIELVQAQGGACTANFGDVETAAGWLAAANLNAAPGFFYAFGPWSVGAGTLIPPAATQTYNLLGGKGYTANDTLQAVIASGNPTLVQFRAWMVMMDFRKQN